MRVLQSAIKNGEGMPAARELVCYFHPGGSAEMSWTWNERFANLKAHVGNTTGAKVLGLALWEEVDLRQNYFTLTVPGNGTVVHVKCRRRTNHCLVWLLFFSLSLRNATLCFQHFPGNILINPFQCYKLNYDPSPGVCWSPNSQGPRMRSYLEIWSL